MELLHLSEFIVLSEELNYSRAAVRCGISQPSLSNHISALEDELGVLLFERTRRHVALTPEGRKLLSDAQRVTDIVKDMHRFNNRILADSGIIIAGAHLDNPTILIELAHRIKSYSIKTNSDIRLLCDYAPKRELLSKLKTHQLDFLVGNLTSRNNPESSNFAAVHLFDDPSFVVLNKENPLAVRKEVTLNDLKNLDFIQFFSDAFNEGWQQLIDRCHQLGFKPRFIRLALDAHDKYVDTPISKEQCLVMGYSGLANTAPFQARDDVVTLPATGESFSIDLFYNPDNIHPLIKGFVEYLESGEYESQDTPESVTE